MTTNASGCKCSFASGKLVRCEYHERLHQNEVASRTWEERYEDAGYDSSDPKRFSIN